jgi:small subunit ribosomal protein S16
MVRLRLTRCGRKNAPFYRIAAFDGRTRRDGKSIEILGWYDPRNKDQSQQISLNRERIAHWLGKGAQPSETVRSLLKNNGYSFRTHQWAGEAENATA